MHPPMNIEASLPHQPSQSPLPPPSVLQQRAQPAPAFGCSGVLDASVTCARVCVCKCSAETAKGTESTCNRARARGPVVTGGGKQAPEGRCALLSASPLSCPGPARGQGCVAEKPGRELVRCTVPALRLVSRAWSDPRSRPGGESVSLVMSVPEP